MPTKVINGPNRTCLLRLHIGFGSVFLKFLAMNNPKLAKIKAKKIKINEGFITLIELLSGGVPHYQRS